jgi:Clp amino terminal domain, pathogenicity island component
MFERFTDRARRVVVLAQEEARLLNHNHIGTEHILLGLVHEGEGVAYVALTELGISLDAVRAQVEAEIGQGSEAPSGHIPFTPRAKKVLELSLREALGLSHNYIGTEHILLGLIREGEGVAARVLVGLGAGLDRVRGQVVQLLATAGASQAEQVAAGPSRIRQQAVTAMVAGGPGSYRDEPAELVRVVPLAREVFHGLGFRMVLISLEVWSGWLDLRYALLPDGPPATPPMQEVALDWQLTDSTTRTYELAGAASGGGRLLRVHHLTFLPGLPEDAGTLTLTARTDPDAAEPLVVVEIELGGAA